MSASPTSKTVKAKSRLLRKDEVGMKKTMRFSKSWRWLLGNWRRWCAQIWENSLSKQRILSTRKACVPSPEKFHGLTDVVNYRKRYLIWFLTARALNALVTRSKLSQKLSLSWWDKDLWSWNSCPTQWSWWCCQVHSLLTTMLKTQWYCVLRLSSLETPYRWWYGTRLWNWPYLP